MLIANIFTKNLGPKFLAIAFALGLWFYVALGAERVANFPTKIPVEVKNVPAGVAVLEEVPNVDVKIRAPLLAWRNLSSSNFAATIDLAGFSKGQYEIPIAVSSANPDVKIIEATPNKINIHIEEIITKDVPVKISVSGEPKDGFVEGEAEISPQEVKMTGPKTLVGATVSAIAPVKLDSEEFDIERNVKLTAFDSGGKELSKLQFSPEQVSVKLPITKATNLKTVGIKVNVSGVPQDGFWISKISTNPAAVSITGEADAISKIEFLETPKIDITGAKSNITKTVALDLPSGVLITKGKPEVQVKLTISPIDSQKTVTASFNFEGGSGSSTDQVQVILSGPAASLADASSGNIKISINLSGKPKGQTQITIPKEAIFIPSGLSIIDYLPKTITITVQ